MKLWDKGYTTHNIVDKFTVGRDRELDLKLAKYDVIGNIAHAKMLHKIGLLKSEELSQLLSELKIIEQSIQAGTFKIEEQFEDVHSKKEFELVRLIGDKLSIKDLFECLMSLSQQHQKTLIPGYTHMQVAMPSSFGLWFGGYAEILIDDIIFLNAAKEISNQNPLGSAAGYGSSFPIDRELTTELLKFKTLKYNVVAAQMSRGKLEKSLSFALSSVASTLTKLSSDVCLYMSQNFNFIGFPKELTTGSSIMPHKQNPDMFELIRAKCNKIQNLPNEITLLTNNLTSGYHRDFQLLKESLMDALDTTKDCLEATTFMLNHIIIKKDILNSNNIYNYLYSVEDVNALVMDGVSFREAYQTIGKQIMNNEYHPTKSINHTHVCSI